MDILNLFLYYKRVMSLVGKVGDKVIQGIVFR